MDSFDYRKALEFHDQLTAAAEKYLALLAKAASRPDDAQVIAVREAIAKNGFWESSEEWRISTTWESRIEPLPLPWKPEVTGYRVTVSCDYCFSSVSPTIERALVFLNAYQRLIMDLFYRSGLGWPGWFGPGQLEG